MKIYIDYIFVIRDVNFASVMCDIASRSTCSIQFFECSETVEIAFPVFLQTSAINQTFINSRLVQKTCEPYSFSCATSMQILLFS